ncbi:SDR family NAD(P)-dependent oxidoreductase [Aeromonas popoffii]|uniref:SDR family NAD(P)-dependent oxidoreductase n=1 Tax=Aeromonas popoffii TaxID=70856 RepID=UPI0005A77C17|nr:SDR family NAD(P)-dependent oxidoreductase [Aeromonas popoffii]
MEQNANRTWVVSGCSSGLGRCWTRSIIEDRQERVIGITRSHEAAETMRASLGERFIPCVADVRDADELAARLAEAQRLAGRPSRVVTAAAYAQFGTLEDLSNEQIRAQFVTNVEGTLNVIRPLLSELRKADDARILLVSSMSGVSCWPLLGAYQISKHGIEAVCSTLREELADSGIQVGCLHPGPHKTGWADTYAQRQPVSASYSAEDLLRRASCGYPVLPPEASLPYFWRMFDASVMPRRLATNAEFAERARREAAQSMADWEADNGA